MPDLTIHLNDTLYAELEQIAHGTSSGLTFSPRIWAQEAVESALAQRRLDRQYARPTVEVE